MGATETLGLLVQIGGDAGGLVSAVKKAKEAFDTFQNTASKVDVTATPAYQRLAARIDAATNRLQMAERQQQAHKASLDKATASLQVHSDSLSKLEALRAQEETHLTKSGNLTKAASEAIAKIDKEITKENAAIIKSYDSMERYGKLTADAGNKVQATKDRIAALNIDLGQVEKPMSKWQAFFKMMDAGLVAFGKAETVVNSFMKLIGVGARFDISGAIGNKLSGFTGLLGIKGNFEKIKESSDSAKMGMGDFAAIAAAAAVATAGVTLVLNAVGAAFDFVTRKIQEGVVAFQNFMKESISGAAREAEMGLAAEYMGKNIGLSREKVDELREALEAQGATGDTASTALTKFAQHGMDASKAMDLLKLAQDASIVSGKDVQSVFEDLIDATAEQRVRSLRLYGIIVNVTEAEENYAKQIGKVKEALTDEDKANALLNETLKKGASLQGLYAEGMKLPAAQLRNITSTLIPEFMDAVGASFIPAFGNVTTAVTDFINAIKASANDTQRLGGLLGDLGQIATLVTGQIRDIVTKQIGGLDQLSYAWGHNLIVQFANGVIAGIGYVIDAINAMASIIEAMLAPGSPPKFLPNIDKWGKETMEVYMNGWNEADFSIFNTISDKFEGFLRSMSGKGTAELVPTIIGMRQAVALAVNEIDMLGKITDPTLTRIQSLFKGSGPIIRDYVVAMLDVAKANKKVQEAQDELNSVTKKYDDQLSVLNDQLEAMQDKKEEQNEDAQLKALQRVLTRVSTTDKQKAQAQAEIDELNLRKKIRLTENEKDTAVTAAQKKLDLAQEEYTSAQKRLALQQSLLDNQQKNNDLLKEQESTLQSLAKAAAAAAEAMKGVGGVSGIKGGADKNKIETGAKGVKGIEVPQWITDLKAKIEELGPKVDTLRGHFENFWKWLNENLFPVLSTLWGWLGIIVPIAIGIMARKWEEMVDSLKTAKKWFTEELIPKLTDLYNALAGKVTSVKTGAEEAKTSIQDWWDVMKPFRNWLSSTFIPYLSGPSRLILTIVKVAIDLLWTSTMGWYLALKDLDKWIRENILPVLTDLFIKLYIFLAPVIERIVKAWNDMYTALSGFEAWLKKALVSGALALLVSWIGDVNKRMKDAVDFVQKLIDKIKSIPRLPFGSWPGSANGGPVPAGGPRIVGERGPELFVPETNGNILSNEKTLALLGGNISAAMPSSIINSGYNRSTVTYNRYNSLNVTSTTPSQGLIADWGRLTVLGA